MRSDRIPDTSARQTTYKLTSESMGHGIQIMADLVKVTEDNIFHLKLHGSLEMYQRRLTPRIDTTIKIFQIRRDTSLAVYRKEFKRIMDGMSSKGVRPNITLQEHPINLSAGGMRIAIEALEPVFPLSMFFLDLDASQPLVCAVAELVWNRHEKDKHGVRIPVYADPQDRPGTDQPLCAVAPEGPGPRRHRPPEPTGSWSTG